MLINKAFNILCHHGVIVPWVVIRVAMVTEILSKISNWMIHNPQFDTYNRVYRPFKISSQHSERSFSHEHKGDRKGDPYLLIPLLFAFEPKRPCINRIGDLGDSSETVWFKGWWRL
jgi:hypothetical protein